jgi:hypothetical protein
MEMDMLKIDAEAVSERLGLERSKANWPLEPHRE